MYNKQNIRCENAAYTLIKFKKTTHCRNNSKF